MIAIVLALFAAASLGAAAMSTSWVANANLDGISFGPRGCSNCCVADSEMNAAQFQSAPGCSETNGAFLEDQAFQPLITDHAYAVFPLAGWVALVACALAALGLATATVLALAGKTPELPVAPTTVALLSIMVGLVSGCVFVATKPGPPGFVGVSWGFWAFGGGAIAGIAAAQMLAKILRPPDPDLLADAMNPDDFSA
jgi:hypothetical protein